MYASKWIFSLFACVVPIEKMGLFFHKFFSQKWIFFYKMILGLIKQIEDSLLGEDELWSILNQIQTSTGKPKKSGGTGAIEPDTEVVESTLMASLRKLFAREDDMWGSTIEKSDKEWVIDEKFIYRLLESFD